MPALKQAVTTSWSATLRLPKSRFPPRPILADRHRYLEQSCDELYKWQRRATPPDKDEFVLHDGPPYANGSLHVGHALNKILKDIVCRTHLLQGRRINYVPGWDCHGLPIELKALQQKCIQSTENRMSAAKVRGMAKKLAEQTVQEQRTGFREWAILADWNHAWKTTDHRYELSQLQVFCKMLEKGLIYQRKKPVYWSPSSRTALAEAELEYNAEHESTAAFVKFPIIDPPYNLQNQLKTGNEISAAIWTTTPWTLVANRAIAVDQDLEYCLVQSAKYGHLLVAGSRLDEISQACRENLSDNIDRTISGRDLLGVTYRNPLLETFSEPRQIVHADFVSADSGTGLVHMAPGHGMEDYILCQGIGIDPFAPVDDEGCFTTEALPHNMQLLAGKPVIGEGSRAVIGLLDAAKALIQSHAYQHSYPYDWRSKQPVIVRATKQWFADLEGIRDETLRALDAVTFVPETGRGRLESFLKTRTEWCISRQRPWGVPIPALYECDTHKALMTPESVTHIIQVMQDRGSEAWWTDDPTDSAWIPPSMRGTADFYRGQDTMDVWFDSGTSWTQMEGPAADVYLEGSDQHRGWFQSSLLTRIASLSKTPPCAPYKTLITHGFTLDSNGRKMSKSMGNVISPSEIMGGTLLPPITRKSRKGTKLEPTYDALGPDALRMWAASSDFSRDIAITSESLQAVQNGVAKLRVTFKLMLGFLDTYQPASTTLTFSVLELNNKLALIELQRLVSRVQVAFDAFQYHRAVSYINTYIADLSAGYIETVKDRMYTAAACSAVRIEAQAVTWQIFQHLCSVLYPITPLLIEEVLDYLPQQLAYHPVRTTWEAQSCSAIHGEWTPSTELKQLIPCLQELHKAVRALQEDARNERQMGSSLQSEVVITVPGTSLLSRQLQEYRAAIEDMLVVSRLVIRHSAPSVSSTSFPGSSLPKEDSPEAKWIYHKLFSIQTVEGAVNIQVTVHSPLQQKCARCWKYTVPDGQNLEQALCTRCVGVLEGIRNSNEVLKGVFDGMPRLEERARSCRKEIDDGLKAHWDLKAVR